MFERRFKSKPVTPPEWPVEMIQPKLAYPCPEERPYYERKLAKFKSLVDIPDRRVTDDDKFGQWKLYKEAKDMHSYYGDFWIKCGPDLDHWYYELKEQVTSRQDDRKRNDWPSILLTPRIGGLRRVEWEIDDPAVRGMLKDDPYPWLVHAERRRAYERHKELDRQLCGEVDEGKKEFWRMKESEATPSGRFDNYTELHEQLVEQLMNMIEERQNELNKQLESETKERKRRLDAFYAGGPVPWITEPRFDELYDDLFGPLPPWMAATPPHWHSRRTPDGILRVYNPPRNELKRRPSKLRQPPPFDFSSPEKGLSKALFGSEAGERPPNGPGPGPGPGSEEGLSKEALVESGPEERSPDASGPGTGPGPGSEEVLSEEALVESGPEERLSDASGPGPVDDLSRPWLWLFG